MFQTPDHHGVIIEYLKEGEKQYKLIYNLILTVCCSHISHSHLSDNILQLLVNHLLNDIC
jgi:hypothetical protein